MAYSSRHPALPIDDPNAPRIHLPEPWPTVRAGLHFFIPIVVLLWCLMVEELSPGLSAFWATATTMVMVPLQPVMLAIFGRATEHRPTRCARRASPTCGRAWCSARAT